jgi:hypothetical protein
MKKIKQLKKEKNHYNPKPEEKKKRNIKKG